MKRILVCEDEDAIRDFVVINLVRSGYDVVDVSCGEDAVKVYTEQNGNFDVALLDIMMPGMDGFALCRWIREQSSEIGIIMLSAKSQEMDKVNCLMIGADDYVTKPFGTAELLARIRIALRHVSNGTPDTPTGKAQNGRLTIDYDKRRIYLDDQEVHLTQVEYKIVMLTLLHIGKVLTYDFIIRCVWGARPTVNNQILRVNMANIRRKLEANPADPQFIITETGVGYRMIDHAEENV